MLVPLSTYNSVAELSLPYFKAYPINTAFTNTLVRSEEETSVWSWSHQHQETNQTVAVGLFDGQTPAVVVLGAPIDELTVGEHSVSAAIRLDGVQGGVRATAGVVAGGEGAGVGGINFASSCNARYTVASLPHHRGGLVILDFCEAK
jgi:hypothetical protein